MLTRAHNDVERLECQVEEMKIELRNREEMINQLKENELKRNDLDQSKENYVSAAKMLENNAEFLKYLYQKEKEKEQALMAPFLSTFTKPVPRTERRAFNQT